MWSVLTNQKTLFRSRDMYWPIRGQYYLMLTPASGPRNTGRWGVGRGGTATPSTLSRAGNRISMKWSSHGPKLSLKNPKPSRLSPNQRLKSSTWLLSKQNSRWTARGSGVVQNVQGEHQHYFFYNQSGILNPFLGLDLINPRSSCI